MLALRNVVLAVAGIAAGIVGIVLLATVGLAILGGVIVMGIAGAVALRVMPKRYQPAPGVRRDAGGLVIDMEPVREPPRP
jgi:hypothetical protein